MPTVNFGRALKGKKTRKNRYKEALEPETEVEVPEVEDEEEKTKEEIE